jgi:hypothetical protein
MMEKHLPDDEELRNDFIERCLRLNTAIGSQLYWEKSPRVRMAALIEIIRSEHEKMDNRLSALDQVISSLQKMREEFQAEKKNDQA